MGLKALKELRAEMLAKLRAILDGAEGESRDLSDDERTNFDGAEGEVLALEARIKRLEKLESWETDTDADTVAQEPGREGRSHRPVPAEPLDLDALDAERSHAFGGWLRGSAINAREMQACESLHLDYRQSQQAFSLGTGRPGEARVQTTDVPSGGGFLTPTHFVNRFDKRLLFFGGLRNYAEVIRTADGSPMDWPGGDDSGNVGVEVAEAPAADIGVTDMAFTRQAWFGHGYSSEAVGISRKLLRDSAVDLEGIVADALAERLGRVTALRYATGTGAGQPEGLESGSVAAFTAASATAFTADEIEDLIQSVDPLYRMGGQLLCHDSTRSVIGKMKDSAGRYLFRHENESTEDLVVHGRPVRIDQGLDAAAPSAGEQSLFFGQLSAYKIRDVGTMMFHRDESLLLRRNQILYIAFMETDGKVLNSGGNPIQHILH